MNGEIKYRVWDNKNKSYNDPYPYAYYALAQDGGLDFYCHGDHMDEADPNVYLVELYTGLKDKNGKEIYAGDIVRYAFEYPKGEWVEEVSLGKISDGEGYYHDHFLAWRTTDKDGDGHQSLLDLEGYCEVIGNIHENPELLKEEE